jgi:hypothetical protein
VYTQATIFCALSSRNSTEITRRQHFDRHHVAGNVVLATVVGMLIEAPVMLLVAVKIVNATSAWYGRKSGVLTYAECCPVPAASSGG